MSLADVDQITLRTSRYWMEDGLVEILLGALFLFLGGGMLVRMVLPRELIWDLLGSALTVVVALGLKWGFQKAKQSITFPRGGYVVLPEPTRKYRFSMWATAVIFALAFASLPLISAAEFTRQIGDHAVPVAATIFALRLVWPALQLRSPRMMSEAILCLLFGALLYLFTGLKGSKGIMVLMSLEGLCMICLGVYALNRFLKTHPLQTEDGCE